MSSLCFSSSVSGTNRSESDFRLRLLLSSSATVAKSPALCFCGLRSEALKLGAKSNRWKVVAAAVSSRNGSGSDGFDYDLVIIGAGVGGHGAALHAVEKGLKTAIIEGDAVGGTCVNWGCVASKALLAVSGRMRELQDEHRMKAFGLQGPQKVKYGKVGSSANIVTANDIIIATGSVPFVPKGVEVDDYSC